MAGKKLTKPHFDATCVPGYKNRYVSMDHVFGGQEAFLPVSPVKMEPVKAETEDWVQKLNSGSVWQTLPKSSKGKK